VNLLPRGYLSQMYACPFSPWEGFFEGVRDPLLFPISAFSLVSLFTVVPRFEAPFFSYRDKLRIARRAFS